MLSRELVHFAETSKSGNQISEYICNTFLGKSRTIHHRTNDLIQGGPWKQQVITKLSVSRIFDRSIKLE